MMIDIILFLFTNLFFIEIQSTQHQQYRSLRSFRLEKRSLAEFDVPHSTTPPTTIPTTSTEIDQQSLEEKVENKIARGYQIIGHKLSQLADQMENNRENIANKFGDFYSGSLADQSGSMYENVQYGSGKFADAVSPFFSWLGRNVIDLGENSGTLLRKSFYSIGDFLGSTVDRTDHFIGDQLIKTAENMHQAALDVEQTSYEDGQGLKEKLIEKTPQIESSLNRWINQIANRLHRWGQNTEITANEVTKHHPSKQIYRI